MLIEILASVIIASVFGAVWCQTEEWYKLGQYATTALAIAFCICTILLIGAVYEYPGDGYFILCTGSVLCMVGSVVWSAWFHHQDELWTKWSRSR